MLVAFEKNGTCQYLVGIAVKDEDDDGEIDVSFKKTSKVDNRFVKPDVDDFGSVQKKDIHALLPPPIATGTTPITKSGLIFDNDLKKTTHMVTHNNCDFLPHPLRHLAPPPPPPREAKSHDLT